jgi:hypothetical protein
MNAQFLRKENKLFRGTGGVSQENRGCSFIPAFYDSYSCQVVISRFANGKPAPIHVLDGLPEDWVIGRDAITLSKTSHNANFAVRLWPNALRSPSRLANGCKTQTAPTAKPYRLPIS